MKTATQIRNIRARIGRDQSWGAYSVCGAWKRMLRILAVFIFVPIFFTMYDTKREPRVVLHLYLRYRVSLAFDRAKIYRRSLHHAFQMQPKFHRNLTLQMETQFVCKLRVQENQRQKRDPVSDALALSYQSKSRFPLQYASTTTSENNCLGPT